MKGSKKIFTLLIFPLFSIAVAFTGCPEPVGSLSDDSGSAPPPPDYIKAEPEHLFYNEKQMFLPDDVAVWRIGSSRKELINVEKITIFIRDRDFDGEEVVPPTGLLLLRGDKDKSYSIKIVSISYLNMETDYRIAVVDPSFGINDGDGTVIIIDW